MGHKDFAAGTSFIIKYVKGKNAFAVPFTFWCMFNQVAQQMWYFYQQKMKSNWLLECCVDKPIFETLKYVSIL